MDQQLQPRWLDPEENGAWRSWLLMSDLLRSQFAHDLWEAGLSEPDFALLVHLSEAPEDRIRMTELAGALRWSKSRLSHQFTRMESRGLVARDDCPDDARSTFARLTPCGRATIERVAPLHVESVRRHFIDLLDRAHLAALTEIGGVVARHLLDIDTPSETAAPPCPNGDPAAL
jgi:DNA-binding MarR family transcriptional regulator